MMPTPTRRNNLREAGVLVFCSVLLAACGREPDVAADPIYGLRGETRWVDVAEGKLKTEVYSTTPLSANRRW